MTRHRGFGSGSLATVQVGLLTTAYAIDEVIRLVGAPTRRTEVTLVSGEVRVEVLFESHWFMIQCVTDGAGRIRQFAVVGRVRDFRPVFIAPAGRLAGRRIQLGVTTVAELPMPARFRYCPDDTCLIHGGGFPGLPGSSPTVVVGWTTSATRPDDLASIVAAYGEVKPGLAWDDPFSLCPYHRYGPSAGARRHSADDGGEALPPTDS